MARLYKTCLHPYLQGGSTTGAVTLANFNNSPPYEIHHTKNDTKILDALGTRQLFKGLTRVSPTGTCIYSFQHKLCGLHIWQLCSGPCDNLDGFSVILQLVVACRATNLLSQRFCWNENFGQNIVVHDSRVWLNDIYAISEGNHRSLPPTA